MSHPLVVHLRKAPFDVRIDRATIWGNPLRRERTESTEQLLIRYRAWLSTQIHLLKQLHRLKDQRLGCWCAPGPCHGDVLAELANGPIWVPS